MHDIALLDHLHISSVCHEQSFSFQPILHAHIASLPLHRLNQRFLERLS